MKNKTILKSVWQNLKLVSAPTPTRAAVKVDADGTKWEWVRSGKRVEVREAV